MSEQRAKYHYAGEEDQARAKPQPVSLTLNSEQVRGVLHCAAQKSPKLLIEAALKVLARDTSTLTIDLLSENDAQVILRTIITKYPNLAQKVIENLNKSAED